MEIVGDRDIVRDGTLGLLAGGRKQTPGSVLHTAHLVEGGWRVIEVWETKDDSDQFFAKHVAQNLPSGTRPKRTVQALHGVVRA